MDAASVEQLLPAPSHHPTPPHSCITQGFGTGFYNGFGGKVEAGETVLQAAHREVCCAMPPLPLPPRLFLPLLTGLQSRWETSWPHPQRTVPLRSPQTPAPPHARTCDAAA